MSVPTAEWFDYQGLKHAFRPAEHGERASRCGNVITSVAALSTEPPKNTTCLPCALADGEVLADHHGANVHRAPEPEAVSSGDNEVAG